MRSPRGGRVEMVEQEESEMAKVREWLVDLGRQYERRAART